MAIQDGLRYLWTAESNRAANFPAAVTTNWGGSFPYAEASMVVLAFENHGFKLANNNSPPTGIYEKYIVRRGLNYVLAQLSSVTLTLQGTGGVNNPCVGPGIEPAPCVGLRTPADPGYSVAVAMLPFAASGALARINTEIATGLGGVALGGKTYGEILQRLTNAEAFGQTDSGTNRGGFGYQLNGNQFDGSTIGWAVLAFLDAAAAGATVPAFVKTEFTFGLAGALNNDGSFDYQNNGNPATASSAGPQKAGIGLQSLFFIGETTGARVTAVTNNINSWWTGAGGIGQNSWSCSGFVNKGCGYTMFNNFKGLKLHGIATLPNVNRPAGSVGDVDDWHMDYQDWLVANQTQPTGTAFTNGGQWAMGFSCCYNTAPMTTAIGELILSPVALVLPDEDKFASVGLAPATGLSNPGPGMSHTVTATAESTSGAPVPGATVTFEVVTGPNAGTTGTAVTGADGKASFTYFDTGGSGTDTIQAHIGDLDSNVVTMVWNSPPMLTAVGPPGAVEATGPGGAPVTFTATATDPEDGTVTPLCETGDGQVVTPGSVFPLGTTLVTCTATDSGGLEDVESFSVTVVDTTPPLVTGADVTAEATGPGGANVSYTVTATDLVDGAVAVSCAPASGSVFALGTTTVDCSATDSRGNTGTGSLTVTVVDTTAPVVTGADVMAEATGPGGASVTYTATATDLVDGSVAISCSPASGSVFALGTTTVDCSATDSHGNTGTGSLTVTVEDTTPPAITGANVTAEATGPAGANVSYTATATDLVDGAVAISCSPAFGSVFALGTTTVDCSATDSHGNTGTGSLTVTVEDTTPPAVTGTSVTAEATGPFTYVSFSTSATDLVDGVVAVSCVPPSGAAFALGNTSVTCSATDGHGNTGTGSLTVTVVDTTPPALTLPADITENATSASGNTISFSASATDLVDGSVPVACVPPSGSSFAITTTTVTCTTTDSEGNTSTGSFSVTVVNTPPVAGGDAFATNEDTQLAASVSANDTDAQGQTLTWQLVDGPEHGTLDFNPLNGSFTYMPNPNYHGPDGFTYRVNDGIVDSDVAGVAITVLPINDAPVAGGDFAETMEDTPVSGNVLSNDSDIEGNPLTAILVGNVSHGVLVFNEDGSYTYFPEPNYHGPDSFTYVASDGEAGSNVATVQIRTPRRFAAVKDAASNTCTSTVSISAPAPVPTVSVAVKMPEVV
jgi:hypothetical protein